MSSSLLQESYQTFEYKDQVSYDMYKGILNAFFITLTKRSIEEGKLYRFPYTLGVFGVLKYPSTTGGWIDWKETLKEGKQVKRNNFHSDNYVAKFFWKTTFPLVLYAKIPSFWEFRLNRESKREMAQLIKHKNTIHKYYNRDDY